LLRPRAVLLALPGAVLLIAAAAALEFADAAVLQQTARGLPYVALAGAALLAARLRNSRLFAATIVVATACLITRTSMFGTSALPHTLFTTFFSLGLALLAFARDRGFSLSTLRNHLLIAFAPMAVAGFFCAGDPERALLALTSQVVDPIYTDWSALPQLALAAVTLALIAVAIGTLRTESPAEAALFWVIVATSSALATSSSPTAFGIWTLCSALILIVAVIEIAYALAFRDELTGLPGRRSLNYALHSLRAPYAIAVVDIDHFKSFNDEHGHEVGDQVLRMVAARLRDVVDGVAYRSGGEEFTIVFAGAGKKEAAQHVEAVREEVASSRFALRRLPRPRHKKGKERRGRTGAARDVLRVTISVGVAAAADRSQRVQEVIEAADQAMYRAKTAGRNRVVA
jgi:diguanylate cyclase (GGDEF)-like protein